MVIMTDAEPTDTEPMKPSSRQVWIVILIVASVAFGVLAAVWIVVNPVKDTLWYEVAKTSLQVLGVAVIGGIVTFATARFQQDRQSAERKREEKRQKAEQDLEKLREEFDRRAALLDRTSRCAQKMFVTCQHVRRVQRDHSPEKDQKDQDTLAEARMFLDETYRDFSAEAAALQVELGARYGIRMTEAKDGVTGEAYLRWHQISDLLTVYYFSLCHNFRKDVLRRNSRCRDPKRHGDGKCHGELHSGLDLEGMVKESEHPADAELRDIRDKIRLLFNEQMPVLADAILKEHFKITADDAEALGG
jgi:hypothetical protein